MAKLRIPKPRFSKRKSNSESKTKRSLSYYIDAKRLTRWIYTVSVILLLAGIISWWRLVYLSPQNVFNRMLSNAFATTSVTKQIKNEDESQKVTETTVVRHTDTHIAKTITEVIQKTQPETVIVSENIGTPTVDYARYTKVQTGQAGANGQPLDFSNVLNVWGRNTTSENMQGDGQTYSQALLGFIPMINMPAQERRELLELIESERVFQIKPEKTKREIRDGRPTYTYTVSVQPSSYIKMLKKIGVVAGLKELDKLDPANYTQAKPVDFELSIDVRSGQLTRVVNAAARRVENYESHGARVPLEEPKDALPIEDLQKRLQEIR